MVELFGGRYPHKSFSPLFVAAVSVTGWLALIGFVEFGGGLLCATHPECGKGPFSRLVLKLLSLFRSRTTSSHRIH